MMTRKRGRFMRAVAAAAVAGVLSFGTGPAPADAQQEAALKPVPQVELDAAKVERFLETWQLIVTGIEQRDSDFDAKDAETVVDQLQAIYQTAATDAAMKDIVAEHGYASFEEWVATAYTILVSRQWVEDPPDSEEFAKARAAVEAMDGIDDDQKREMLKSLEEAVGVVADMEPTAANKAAVEPFLDAITSVLEADAPAE